MLRRMGCREKLPNRVVMSIKSRGKFAVFSLAWECVSIPVAYRGDLKDGWLSAERTEIWHRMDTPVKWGL